jgi:hypothetical protein
MSPESHQRVSRNYRRPGPLQPGERHLHGFWERGMDGNSSWYFNVVIGLLVFVCGFSFRAARLYLVVEAVLSIKHLPAAANQRRTGRRSCLVFEAKTE